MKDENNPMVLTINIMHDPTKSLSYKYNPTPYNASSIGIQNSLSLLLEIATRFEFVIHNKTKRSTSINHPPCHLSMALSLS